MTEQTKVIGYIRVSTIMQAQDGVSLEAQSRKLQLYAELYNLNLVGVVSDPGYSAKNLNRPGLQRCLAMLQSGKADGLLVPKLDRLTRSVADLGNLLKTYFQKYGLLSVGEQIDTRTAAGRLVLNVLTSVAEWEREATGERTSAALQHKAAMGEYTGGQVPYGFQLSSDGVHIEENESEQQVIGAIRELKNAGLSLRKIAAELARRGFKTRRGGIIRHTQIKRILAA